MFLCAARQSNDDVQDPQLFLADQILVRCVYCMTLALGVSLFILDHSITKPEIGPTVVCVPALVPGPY